MTKPDPGPQAWFDKADKDLRQAELARHAQPDLADLAVYHAQQCAEKYFKGFLVSMQISFRFSHDLVYLLDLCMAKEKAFADLVEATDLLNDLAGEIRYPTEETDAVSLQTADTALELARRIRDWVRQRLGKQ